MKVDYFPTSNIDRTVWERICPVDTFSVYRPAELPIPLPAALVSKYDSVLVTCSGLNNNEFLFYMLNGNRLDHDCFDQMPFGMAFYGSNPVTSGILLQHGGWSNRTTTVPSGFAEYLRNNSLGNCFPLGELPTVTSGKLDELQIASHRKAFEILIGILRAKFVLDPAAGEK